MSDTDGMSYATILWPFRRIWELWISKTFAFFPIDNDEKIISSDHG